MAEFKVKIKGIDALLQKLARFEVGLINMAEVFAGIGEEFTAYYAGMFPAQGSPYNKPWPALQPKTVLYKSQHIGSMKAGVSPSQPLIFSGKMQESFKFEATPVGVRVYNDVQSKNGYNYFKAHQLGLGHNPERVMMALNGQLRESARQSVRKGIKLIMEGA